MQDYRKEENDVLKKRVCFTKIYISKFSVIQPSSGNNRHRQFKTYWNTGYRKYGYILFNLTVTD